MTIISVLVILQNLAVPRRAGKTIKILEMRRRGGKRHAIDDQVPNLYLAGRSQGVIFFQPQRVAAQADKPFDIKGVLLIIRQTIDAMGVEDNDLAAAGRPKIIGEPIYAEAVAG